MKYIFHFPISGIDVKDEHPLNKLSISSKLSIFHFKMFGIFIKDEQLKNIYPIFLRLDVFHLEISGKFINLLYYQSGKGNY